MKDVTKPKVDLNKGLGNFFYKTLYNYNAGLGLTKQTVNYIHNIKGEAAWIKKFRLRSLDLFYRRKNPTNWASWDINKIDYNKIQYYLSKNKKSEKSWKDVPKEIKYTFEKLGIPEQERKFLAGVEAQFDSEAAYSNLKSNLTKQGVLFLSSSEALTKHPEIFKPFFSKIIPAGDNKFSALNSAVFSGGSFIYIPKGVKLKQPLQAYFRINAENFGQFERTLIIADEGSEVTYIEGCTAPKFNTATLHSAVVELVALKNAKIQYITVQNWSSNVFNLVTKRGLAFRNSEIKWIDCNIGSRLTMKYPSVILKEEGAKGEVLSIAIASKNQHQDTGAKMIHLANSTSSNIIAKSISLGHGKTTYRGLVKINKNLKSCRNNTQCDALLINNFSQTDTYPTIVCNGSDNVVEHEATVSKVSDDQILYMRQRGLSKVQAVSLTVNGFINDLISEFPIEYSVELKRLIEMEMEGSVG